MKTEKTIPMWKHEIGKCPICGAEVEFTEAITAHNPTLRHIPETIYDFWCTKGSHLIQSVNDIWVVHILARDGDEIYSFVFDEEWNLVKIEDRWDPITSYCNLEGTTR